MFKRLILALTLMWFVTACSTVKTVQSDKDGMMISSQGFNTKCNSLPRVYSGVAYNFCLLYGEPNSSPNSFDFARAEIMLWDSALSFVADTIILPYTIPAQMTSGNILIK